MREAKTALGGAATCGESPEEQIAAHVANAPKTIGQQSRRITT